MRSFSSLDCKCVFGRLFSDDLAGAALHAHCHLIQRGLSGRNTQSLQSFSRTCLHCDLYCPPVRYVQCWTQVLQLRLCQHQVLLAVLDSNRWKRVRPMKAGQPAPRDKTSGRRMECAGGTHSGWPPTLERRSLHGKCERGEDADGRNALQRIFGSACSYHSHREGRRNFCSGTRPEPLHAETAAVLAPAWRHFPSFTRVRHRKEEKWEMEERSKMF